MIVGTVIVSVYIGYFLYDFYKNRKIDKQIKRYEETHPVEEKQKTEKKKVYTTRKQWYNEVYLKSDHWQQIRKVALDRAGHKCQVCASRNKVLNVHHNTYDNLWHERMTDLCVLCEDCHKLYSKSKSR